MTLGRKGRILGTGTAQAVAALVFWPIVSEAVLVSPHAVFIDARTRSSQVTLYNPGTQAEEITLDLRYGFPTTDSVGGIYVRMFDPESIPAGHPAATSWLRVFPRRAVVRPGERQVVRVLASPPQGLADGEYWSRMIITARGAQVTMPGGDSAVSAGVSLVVSQVISVAYRNGSLSTQVNLHEFRAELVRDSLIAWVGLERQGNAAWLGSTWLRIRNPAGQVVRQWDTPTAVYFATLRRFALPLEGLAAGDYVAEVELNNAREDIDRRHILPAPVVRRTAAVAVQ
jgi:hypothetical protein